MAAATGPPPWRRAAREPLLHFALLGGLLFAVYAALHRGRGGADAGAARPAVAVDAATLDRLAGTFRRAWKRDPTRDELGEMTLDFVDEELLFREALALHLDRDDPAVRRRLIEKMAVMMRPPSAPPEPTPDELRAWYASRRHHFHQPARFWLRQIFFDPERRRGAINRDAAAALDGLQRAGALDAGGVGAAAGDPSPLPADVDGLTDLQIAHLFGNGFLQSLAPLPLERWQGPLSSLRGVHLVRIARREPARDPPFDEVAAAVKADWITSRSKGHIDAAAALLPRYRVQIAPEARRRLEGAALLAPVLEAASP